jgi:hypothetical protein
MSEKDNSQLEGNEPVITDEEIDKMLEEGEPENDVQKELAKKDAIIRQLTARAKKAEQQQKNFDINKRDEKVGVDDDIKQTVQSLALAERKRQFGYENNLSPDETDHIFKINPNPTKEVLEDPFVKGGLQAIRAKKRVESNTPNSTSRSPRFEIPKKEDLTPDDKQKAFEEFMSSRKR